MNENNGCQTRELLDYWFPDWYCCLWNKKQFFSLSCSDWRRMRRGESACNRFLICAIAKMWIRMWRTRYRSSTHKFQSINTTNYLLVMRGCYLHLKYYDQQWIRWKSMKVIQQWCAMLKWDFFCILLWYNLTFSNFQNSDSHILGAFVGLDKCSRFSTLDFVTIDISLDAAVESKLNMARKREKWKKEKFRI